MYVIFKLNASNIEEKISWGKCLIKWFTINVIPMPASNKNIK